MSDMNNMSNVSGGIPANDFSALLARILGGQNESEGLNAAMGDLGIEGIGAPADVLGGGGSSDLLSKVGTGVGAISNLAKMYFSHKAGKRADAQIQNANMGVDRNNANQAQLINNTLAARYRAAQAYNGTPATQQSVDQYMAKSAVDGSPLRGG